MNNNNLKRFLWITFVASYAWQLIIFFTGGVNSFLFPLLMWIPGLSAIIVLMSTSHKLRKIGWGLRRWWYLFPPILISMGVVAAEVFMLQTFNLGDWSNEIFIFRGYMVDIPKIPLILGNHTQRIDFFTVNFVLSILLQSVLGCVVTLGEELGWRGYAQKEFIRKYGLNKGLIVLGVVWGYWHLPIILMGYNFPHHRILGALVLMPLGTIFLGIFLGWLYLRSKSIWVPASAHAAMNLTAMVLFNGVTMSGYGLFQQIIWIGLWGIVATFCLISINWKRPEFRMLLPQDTSSRSLNNLPASLPADIPLMRHIEHRNLSEASLLKTRDHGCRR